MLNSRIDVQEMESTPQQGLSKGFPRRQTTGPPLGGCTPRMP